MAFFQNVCKTSAITQKRKKLSVEGKLAARPRTERSVGDPVIICLLFHLPTFMARESSGPAYRLPPLLNLPQLWRPTRAGQLIFVLLLYIKGTPSGAVCHLPFCFMPDLRRFPLRVKSAPQARGGGGAWREGNQTPFYPIWNGHVHRRHDAKNRQMRMHCEQNQVPKKKASKISFLLITIVLKPNFETWRAITGVFFRLKACRN